MRPRRIGAIFGGVDDKPSKIEPGELQAHAEPPVIARLVIEIRSDGTRTIARGAAEDLQRGEKVQLQAEGRTPLELAFSLLGALKDVPAIARSFTKGLLKK